MAGDLITGSTRPEFLPLVHNLAMLHATLRLRKELYHFAWKEDYKWSHKHLMVWFLALPPSLS